jgi:hypothetical protein
MDDRIKLKIAGITLMLKPLSTLEQIEVTSHKTMDAGVEIEDTTLSSFAYVKHAVKGIKGVKMYNGDEYELEFDGEVLSDKCTSEIFTLSLGVEFLHAVQRLKYNDISEKLTYFGQKKPLKGVKLEVIPTEGVEK